MNILAFVPARFGSKGIKNKNMAMLGNKPLIYYTLNTLKNIKKDVYPFISTDSKKIKKYCNKIGFSNNYLRPKNLSKDSSTVFYAIKHALEWLKKNENKIFDAVLMLQPTSPLRKHKDLMLAIKKFRTRKIKSLISVTKMKEHPYECIKYSKKRFSYLVNNSHKNTTNRQGYKNFFYFIDGSFYLARTDFLIKNKGFLSKKFTKIFIQKNKWPIDIDDPEDLIVAKSFLKKYKM